MNDELQYLVGLNMGPVEDHTSMAVVERRRDPVDGGEYTYRVLGLERCPQGTPYAEVVEWVKARLAEYPADQIGEVVVGGTEIVPSVVELLQTAGLGSRCR